MIRTAQDFVLTSVKKAKAKVQPVVEENASKMISAAISKLGK